MNVLPARIDRFLLAAALGLTIAVFGSLSMEQSPSAAIARGDFPAFYTMATLASRDDRAQFYDLETQRQIQNEIWDSFQGSVLPVAYPPFLAFWIEPLASLSPTVARLVWIGGMVMCVVAGGVLISRASPSLRGLSWQVIVCAFLFAPLFLGVLGGQIVGLSVLLYAAFMVLDRRHGRWSEVALGVITGLWMYKPHFAIAAGLVLILRKRWIATVSWILTSFGLWWLGALVVGTDWIARWYSFAREFSNIDLITNAPRMTGVIPFFYTVSGCASGGLCFQDRLWEIATFFSALFVPIVLSLAWWRSPARKGGDLSLLLGPLLVLFAPAVNFYDLALCALPLLLTFAPSRRSDCVLAGAVFVGSQLVLVSKDMGVGGVCFLFALFLGYLVIRGIQRERAERIEERSA